MPSHGFSTGVTVGSACNGFFLLLTAGVVATVWRRRRKGYQKPLYRTIEGEGQWMHMRHIRVNGVEVEVGV